MGYKVAVLMGGSSFEREFSLASGQRVCEALESKGHKVLPLDTTSDLVSTLRSERPDVAYVALHGGTGEDGTVHSLLECLGIPYVGSPSAVCRLSWNKSLLPHILSQYSGHRESMDCCSWPQGVCLSKAAFKDMGAAGALDLIESDIPAGFPLCVKPASCGSAMGITKVERSEDLAQAILEALSYDREVIIQEWIDGVELGVSIMDLDDGPLVLPPVEICPKDQYDTAARLDSSAAQFFAPVREESLGKDAESAAAVRAEIERAALEAYHAFRCRDLARIDMIWDGAQARLLEVDISPGMTPLSMFPASCEAMGQELADVLEALLQRAIQHG